MQYTLFFVVATKRYLTSEDGVKGHNTEQRETKKKKSWRTIGGKIHKLNRDPKGQRDKCLLQEYITGGNYTKKHYTGEHDPPQIQQLKNLSSTC